MKRLVVFGLLLTFAACAQQAPPPAATAPPPQLAAAPPPAPPAPPPPLPPHTSFDGLYQGTFVAQPYGGGTQELTGGNCDPGDMPINMRVKRSYVRIWYKDYRGHLLHYRGTINSDGTIETSHTNRGGGGAILALQVSDNQATGNLQRGRCWYSVTMARSPDSEPSASNPSIGPGRATRRARGSSS
jgi:hypothetical protein